MSDLMWGLIFIFIITVAVFALRLAEATRRNKEATEALVGAKAVQTDHAIRFRRGESKPEANHHRNVGIVANVLLRVLRNYVAEAKPTDAATNAGDRPAHCERGPQPAMVPPAGERSTAKVNTVLVEGHTDSVPIRTTEKSPFKDNLDLSAARSAQVFRMMVECEPELSGLLNRVGSSVLSVSGYGETRPVDPEHGEADANRRIDLRFLMEPPEVEPAAPPAPVREVRQELRE